MGEPAPIIRFMPENQRKPAFNHSTLDDYGLDPWEFRLYMRVRRREDSASSRGCDESVPRMAEGCGMSERRAQLALRVLVRTGLLKAQERVGATTIYRTTQPDAWTPPDQVDDIRQAIRSGSPSSTTPAPDAPPTQDVPPAPDAGEGRTTCTPTPAPDAPKGSPPKVLPEGSPNTPPKPPQGGTTRKKRTAKLPDWVDPDAWADWERYNRERGLALRPSTVKAQLKKLDALRASESQQSIINRAIERQWRSFFPDRSVDSSRSSAGDVKNGTSKRSALEAKRRRDEIMRREEGDP